MQRCPTPSMRRPSSSLAKCITWPSHWVQVASIGGRQLEEISIFARVASILLEIDAQRAHVDVEIFDFKTHRLMVDFVIAEDGRDYERTSIECWIHERADSDVRIIVCYSQDLHPIWRNTVA